MVVETIYNNEGLTVLPINNCCYFTFGFVSIFNIRLFNIAWSTRYMGVLRFA